MLSFQTSCLGNPYIIRPSVRGLGFEPLLLPKVNGKPPLCHPTTGLRATNWRESDTVDGRNPAPPKKPGGHCLLVFTGKIIIPGFLSARFRPSISCNFDKHLGKNGSAPPINVSTRCLARALARSLFGRRPRQTQARGVVFVVFGLGSKARWTPRVSL